jgi:hypothetical protein
VRRRTPDQSKSSDKTSVHTVEPFRPTTSGAAAVAARSEGLTQMFKHSLVSLAFGAAMLATAQAGTHLGQASVASHVTLIAKLIPNGSPANKCNTASFEGQDLYRVYADGTTDSKPFTVPNGHYLVVTDVEWAAQGGVNGMTGPLAANRSLVLEIDLRKPGFSGSGNSVYTSPGIWVYPALVEGVLGDTDHLASGFVVGPGVSICPQAYETKQLSGKAAKLFRIQLHGYLSQ